MIRYIALLLLLSLAAISHAQTCEQLEEKVEYVTNTLPIVTDQLGPIGAMRTVGFQGIHQCPSSESLWYAAVRSAELLGMPPGSTTLSSLVAQAIQHAPNSARIATVAARVTGSPDQARKAVALDPNYRPAQRALAIALAHAGKTDEALRLCQVAHPTKQDVLTCSRVLLIAGRTAEAIPVARKAVASGKLELKEEVVPAQFLDRDAHELLGSALLKAGRTREATQSLRIAASEGSVTAQQQLDSLNSHP